MGNRECSPIFFTLLNAAGEAGLISISGKSIKWKKVKKKGIQPLYIFFKSAYDKYG
jgi:hypothetical protein